MVLRLPRRVGLPAWIVSVSAALVAIVPVIGPAVRAAERPPVIGRNAGVSAGHPLTTAAAFEVLTKGGNAFDAGVAALLVGGVVEQDLYSLGGEALVLVYPQSTRKVVAVVGQGWAPKNATIDWYTKRGKDLNGAGLDPAVVPGALHAALTVLDQWGTMSFEQVSARAIEYAEQGFPLRPRTARAIEGNLKFFESWPDNRRYWLKPDGSMYAPGETIRFPTLAHTLKLMVEAERAAARQGRTAGIVAARDRFYKGDIARDMVAFLKQHQAPFELDDFSEFFARIEAPATTSYRGYQVYKHSFGSQGPVLLEALNILEQFDLKSMKHNSADYLHTVVEALKLAYADRDSYYGDPAFVRTPAEGLLSKAYARERSKLIDPKRASRAFVAGNPLSFDSTVKEWKYWVANVADGHTPGQPVPDAEPLRGTAQRHDAHRDHRPCRQHLRQHAQRRLDSWRRHSWQHRDRDERARRTVLARRDACCSVAAARPAALHADAEHRAAQWRAVHGARDARRRQPGSDDPPSVPERGRVLACLVPEPPRSVRVASRSDITFLRIVLAAHGGVQ